MTSKLDKKYWDKPQLNIAKTETNWLKTEMKLMIVVLGEWGLTTESAELDIGKLIYVWSGWWEPEPTSREDVAHVCASTWKVSSM